MKITKSQLKQIIKEELELAEVSNTDPTKILGDMNVRLEPLLTRLRSMKRAVKGTNDELVDLLSDLITELDMHFQVTYKYRDLGEIR